MATTKKAASKKAATPKKTAAPKKAAAKKEITSVEKKTGNHFIDDMSISMLKTFCKKQGIKIPANALKEEIANLIKKAKLEDIPLEIKNFAAEY